jgi:hypothetical protein
METDYLSDSDSDYNDYDNSDLLLEQDTEDRSWKIFYCFKNFTSMYAYPIGEKLTASSITDFILKNNIC